jgi:phosphatidylserine/phosphatidylglycerophosphate/cardiolipin synthase-like enzyme
MLVSPVADTSALTWSHTTVSDLPPRLQLLAPPSGPGVAGAPARPASVQPALLGAGSSTALRYPGSGRWWHAQESGSQVHWVWGRAADVLVHGTLRTRLPLGNPVVALRFVDAADATGDTGDPHGVMASDPVTLAGAPIMVSSLRVLALAPGAPGMDTLSVLRYLSAAFDAEGLSLGSPTWQAFVAAMSGLQAPLRVLEPGGSPATGRPVAILGQPPVTLTAAHLGDAVAALGTTRAALLGVTLDVSAGGPSIASTNGVAHPDGHIPIGATTSTISTASLHDWLSPQQSAALTRFTRGNTVRPFVDGVATFDDLFTQVNRAVGAGAQGAFYVTGYSLQHKAVLGPMGAGTPQRRVLDVATAMAAAGGEARFLAIDMLQLNPGWARDVEIVAQLTALLLGTAGIVAAAFQPDDTLNEISFLLHAEAIAVLVFVGSLDPDGILEKLFELNKGDIEALAAIAGVEAHLDPVDAQVDDNPRAMTTGDLAPLVLGATRKFNVFHQKIQVVRTDEGVHAYCGGIDLNADRLQTPGHGSRSPLHDVHARVDGPATAELFTTFAQRWQAVAGTTLALSAPGALAGLPTGGTDVVQVGRTYYKPLAGSGRGLPYAPAGESTILETMTAAIGRARRYLYLEDQYLTPPPAFADALVAAAGHVSGPLIIAVPASPDQPFGLPRRQALINDLRAAWGDRVRVGILRRRFSHTSTSRESSAGRLWLAEDVAAGDNVIEVSPPARVPSTPFWLTVDGEVMRATHEVAGFSSPISVRLDVERWEDTRLFDATSGTARARHYQHAAVSCGTFPSIYVHAKMLLVDDAFAAIGSANANRRGYYSDGECSVLSMREQVTDGDNWIRDLRIALWAEHLGLAPQYAAVALRDPAVGLALFDRRFTVGSRFTTFDAQPYATEYTLSAELNDKTTTLKGLIFIAKYIAGLSTMIAGAGSDDLFDTFVDPSSWLEGP